MKLFLLFVVVIFLNCSSNAQTATVATNSFSTDSIAEHLVKMALLSARISNVENQSTQIEYNFKRSRSAWLNNIILTGNLNEFSLKQGGTVDPLKQSTQYPRYNVGVVLPVGLFINNNKQTKAAYYTYQSSLNEVEIEKQRVTQEVLTYYENYKLYKSSLALQQQVLQDAKVLLVKQEEKFKAGNLSLETYTATSRAYNAEELRQLNVLHDLNVSKIQLSNLIGMDIEVAIDMITNSQK